ncbi:Ig-like domain-containing protein [Vagococcus sp. BWB3-3]|uniref:Ig-like domain-containing protein n=1 Tax=Vagococcus allomyrinae TaxID=2794353 RepID=A0A940SWB3_9ENTE|nr:Ig-like domain-containing protein [Vagococcus allomyrinae]MBP1042809.1 Ig-like domain-containing protein [Vagococcus allomyrinae]
MKVLKWCLVLLMLLFMFAHQTESGFAESLIMEEGESEFKENNEMFQRSFIPSDQSELNENRIEKKILNLINSERVAEGVRPLVLNLELYNGTFIRSKEALAKQIGMASVGQVPSTGGHSRPNGSWWTTIFEEISYDYKATAENIYSFASGDLKPGAVGNYTEDYLAQRTYDGWKNSSDHRANYMNPAYKEIGIGISLGDGIYPSAGKTYYMSFYNAISILGTQKDHIDPTSIKIKSDKSIVYVGDKLQLDYTITPLNTTLKEVAWKSQDDTIATVDGNGVLTGKKTGKVKIYLEHPSSGVDDEIEVEILNRDGLAFESAIKINPVDNETEIHENGNQLYYSFTVPKTQEYQLIHNGQYSDSDLYDKNQKLVVTKSRYHSYVSVSLVAGETYVYRTQWTTGTRASKLLLRSITEVGLASPTTKIDVGQQLPLTLITTPNADYEGVITYKSSNPKRVSVNEEGMLTGIEDGKATISVTTLGISKSFEVRCVGELKNITFESANKINPVDNETEIHENGNQLYYSFTVPKTQEYQLIHNGQYSDSDLYDKNQKLVVTKSRYHSYVSVSLVAGETYVYRTQWITGTRASKLLLRSINGSVAKL